ncbi:MAG: glycogen synthase GlgA, partial [Nitrospira sp.]|nr:glycogen synthase GlgA [Nitrospira sp.]
MASPEAVPFAKTGGLADVAGALPCELARLGHRVCLVIPRYGAIDGAALGLKEWRRLAVPTALGTIKAAIEQGTLPDGQGRVLAVRHDPYFDRAGLYQESGRDYPDNLERFAFFSRAVLELLPVLQNESGWVPDVLHAHDWQTALSLVYLRTRDAGAPRHAIRTMFTIHNIGYQGLFPARDYWKTGLGPELFTPKTLEFYGSVNLMKGGLVFADSLTTVSPTYSREIQTPEFGFGLDGVLRERQDRLAGIINGIDAALWNPETDAYLPCRYSAADLSGKKVCKAAVQREMALPVREEVPLLGIVSRLTEQKGLDLVADILPELAMLDLQVALLGSGDPATEARFRALQAQFPRKVGLSIGFDDGLAHRIEAGADMFVMPSRYEPCGLSQLYSLRYGTVPIVRRTGGLADTVVSYSPQAIREGRATGFLFGEATKEALLATVLLALRVYAEGREWQALIRAGMAQDVSWAKSARAYVELYRKML